MSTVPHHADFSNTTKLAHLNLIQKYVKQISYLLLGIHQQLFRLLSNRNHQMSILLHNTRQLIFITSWLLIILMMYYIDNGEYWSPLAAIVTGGKMHSLMKTNRMLLNTTGSWQLWMRFNIYLTCNIAIYIFWCWIHHVCCTCCLR